MTLPTTLYLALSTAAYSDTATGSAMSEVVGGGYARVAFTRSTTNFPTATGAAPTTIKNAVSLAFPAATAAQGTALSLYVVSASAAGNCLYGFDLTTSITIATGDTPVVPSNGATFTED